MASSSKQNWQLGDAGILRKKEDEDELLVFGYSCKLFRDDEKALYIDQGKHLIPWMGDDTLKIDRYDGRGTLYDLKQYEPLPGGYDESLWVGLSDSERHVEHLCNEERYHALHHNEDEEALYQEKCLPEGRGLRRKRQFQSEASCCPVCGVTVRSTELHAHLDHEIEKLGKLRSKHRRLSETAAQPTDAAPNRQETFVKIKANRTSRIRVKKPKPNVAKCPVCNLCIRGNVEDLSTHVENCLRVQDEEVNVDGEDNSFEEYEWAGQSRVRATTLLDGGYAAAGMSTVNRSDQVDEDSDLVVDEDDSDTFGPVQYSEADLKPLEEAERTALRDAVIRAGNSSALSDQITRENISNHAIPNSSEHDTGSSEGNSNIVNNVNGHLVGDTVLNLAMATSSKVVTTNITSKSKEGFLCTSTMAVSGCNETAQENNHILLKALKSRINELEKVLPVKCLICLGSYVQPVVSVNCWHVYCEECWLHSLGAKKLCPLCNAITSPSDLRKIYI